MKRLIVCSTLAAVVAGGAVLLLWPRSDSSAQPGVKVTPQVNAEGCSCSRPTTVGSGREQLALYYCACPGVQCVLTATAAGSAAPPNVVQNCRADAGTPFTGPR
jgi:hypothetical protein